jgi:hypothetical protein
MDAEELRRALRIASRVLERGDCNHLAGADNHWLKVPVRDHVARALVHLDKFLVGAAGEADDLAHALTRLLLAVELRAREREALRLLAANTEQRRAR